jgi:hypothetical protein
MNLIINIVIFPTWNLFQDSIIILYVLHAETTTFFTDNTVQTLTLSHVTFSGTIRGFPEGLNVPPPIQPKVMNRETDEDKSGMMMITVLFIARKIAFYENPDQWDFTMNSSII